MLESSVIRCRLVVLCLFTAFSSIPPVLAQADRSTLTGTVTDLTGAVITRVNVEILSVATGATRDTTTNDGGIYLAPRLPAGKYAAAFSIAGAGGQVDIVSKPGTNEFHGIAREYLRNSFFDSRFFPDLDLHPASTVPTRVLFPYQGIRQFRGQTLNTSHQLKPILDAYPLGQLSVDRQL